MAARPPANNSSDPDTIEFGIAALDARLDDADLDFPATADEVLAAVDQTAIPVDGSGNTVELETALSAVSTAEFDSETELLDLLHPVFENYRAKSSSGVFGRLRGLLPF
ncbi:hypothetical protein ACNS7O_13370 [Haloferacaceae archaeon DSL9]